MRRKNLAIVSIMTQKYKLADFTLFLLNSLSKNIDEFVLVASDKLDIKNINDIDANISCVYTDVAGSDFDRWAFGISKYKGIEDSVDTITLLNDSFYGPVFSFDGIWNEMNGRACDFWGISKQKDIAESLYYVEPYFVVLRSEKLIKYVVDNYTTNSREIDEILFVKELEKLGFVSEVYVNNSSIENKEIPESFLLYDSFEMINRYHNPFIPRYLFSIKDDDMQFFGSGFQRIQTLDYIKNTEYPIENVYSDLIIQHNMSHLVNVLGLNFIVDENKNLVVENSMNLKVAVFIYLFYEENVEVYLKKIQRIPSWVDVYIFSPSRMDLILSEIAHQENVQFINVDGRGREWASYLIEAKSILKQEGYVYACFLHDKSFHKNEYPTQAYDFRDLLWDNLVPAGNGIEEIINTFENNKHIGLLLPPIVKHGSYFKLFMDFWTANFDRTIQLAQQLGIKTYFINREYSPLAIGSMFWCRVDALDRLWEFDFQRDFFPEEPMDIDGTVNHALERILPFVAQDSGYYSAFVGTKRWYEYDALVCSYMLRRVNTNLEHAFLLDV